MTMQENYPLPLIADILDKLAGKSIFSTIDAISGYYQLAMAECLAPKTAFTYKGLKYEFKRMPFGLCNAPATFQSLMNEIFVGRAQNFVLPYLDDTIIFSNNIEKHRRHLEHVISKTCANIYLNHNKCKFYRSNIKILGNIVLYNKVMPDQKNQGN